MIMISDGGDKNYKPRPDFSNVQSGSSSTSPARSGAANAGAAGGTKTYVVVKGDSLSKIAQRFYGDAHDWRRIYEANRDQINDPDLIHPGQELRIPEASESGRRAT
ncbi:MAG TPA: LysM peptidoglycan-binding domain-containing protein [Candidatus Eisenbacteria bacterium]|nr:LysM peptidoglycan-binding domain-containing protein [Candidatus Eisenbacteria bacterium]